MSEKPHQMAGLSYWFFLYLILIGIENAWNASWVADLFLAALFALFFIEKFNRFWTEFWDHTLSALLAPIWDSALLDPVLGKAVPDEAFWAVTARKYWQAHYMVREDRRNRLWAIWLCTLIIGPLLIFSILAGNIPLTQIAIISYMLSVFAGWLLMHTKSLPNQTQALSNASGRSSAAFRAIMTSANLSPVLPIPDFVHPKRRGKFFLEFGYFIGASVPVVFLFFWLVEDVPVSWNIGTIALLVLQFVGCLLMIFSWLVVVIRMGLPLARYQRGIDSPEHPCVLVWLADMQDAIH